MLRLKEASVREILTSDEPQVDLAKKFHISRELIRRIRSGKSYAEFCPDIERVPTRSISCHACLHWALGQGHHSGHCTLGIPESREPGIGQHYARVCNNFIPPGGDHVPIDGVLL